MTYRVGGSWKITIVREGAGEPDEHGHRDGDELVAVVLGDRGLAARIVSLLNAADPDVEPPDCYCCSGGLGQGFHCRHCHAKGYCG